MRTAIPFGVIAACIMTLMGGCAHSSLPEDISVDDPYYHTLASASVDLHIVGELRLIRSNKETRRSGFLTTIAVRPDTVARVDVTIPSGGTGFNPRCSQGHVEFSQPIILHSAGESPRQIRRIERQDTSIPREHGLFEEIVALAAWVFHDPTGALRRFRTSYVRLGSASIDTACFRLRPKSRIECDGIVIVTGNDSYLTLRDVAVTTLIPSESPPVLRGHYRAAIKLQDGSFLSGLGFEVAPSAGVIESAGSFQLQDGELHLSSVARTNLDLERATITLRIGGTLTSERLSVTGGSILAQRNLWTHKGEFSCDFQLSLAPGELDLPVPAGKLSGHHEGIGPSRYQSIYGENRTSSVTWTTASSTQVRSAYIEQSIGRSKLSLTMPSIVLDPIRIDQWTDVALTAEGRHFPLRSVTRHGPEGRLEINARAGSSVLSHRKLVFPLNSADAPSIGKMDLAVVDGTISIDRRGTTLELPGYQGGLRIQPRSGFGLEGVLRPSGTLPLPTLAMNIADDAIELSGGTLTFLPDTTQRIRIDDLSYAISSSALSRILFNNHNNTETDLPQNLLKASNIGRMQGLRIASGSIHSLSHSRVTTESGRGSLSSPLLQIDWLSRINIQSVFDRIDWKPQPWPIELRVPFPVVRSQLPQDGAIIAQHIKKRHVWNNHEHPFKRHEIVQVILGQAANDETRNRLGIDWAGMSAGNGLINIKGYWRAHIKLPVLRDEHDGTFHGKLYAAVDYGKLRSTAVFEVEKSGSSFVNIITLGLFNRVVNFVLTRKLNDALNNALRNSLGNDFILGSGPLRDLVSARLVANDNGTAFLEVSVGTRPEKIDWHRVRGRRVVWADHTGSGDAEFNGNGPELRATFRITFDRKTARLRTEFHAKETKSDWTEGKGHDEFLVYTAPPGYSIAGIAGQLTYRDLILNVDRDHRTNTLRNNLGSFRLYGDSDGDDIGSYTRLETDFDFQMPVLLERDPSASAPLTPLTVGFSALASTRGNFSFSAPPPGTLDELRLPISAPNLVSLVSDLDVLARLRGTVIGPEDIAKFKHEGVFAPNRVATVVGGMISTPANIPLYKGAGDQLKLVHIDRADLRTVDDDLVLTVSAEIK